MGEETHSKKDRGRRGWLLLEVPSQASMSSSSKSIGKVTFENEDEVDVWLNDLNIGSYAKAIKNEGYTTLGFIKDASWEDMKELAEKTAMKTPHEKALLRGWEEFAHQDCIPLRQNYT